MTRNGREVNRTIRRPAERGVDDDRVLKRIARENPGWLQILLNHLDNPAPGAMTHL